MTKRDRGRMRVRPVEQASILDKRFKPFIERPRRLRPQIHPLMVITDLRKGSLASLDRYLAQEGGVPDREVAVELRKLISGSQYRSRFRLLVIEHPNGPKNRGGKPAGQEIDRVKRYSQIAARYHQVHADVRKAWRAKELVAEEFACSKSTIARALQAEKEATRRSESADEAKERRLSALAKLREGRGTPSD